MTAKEKLSLLAKEVSDNSIVITSESIIEPRTTTYTAWLYFDNNYIQKLYSGNYKEMTAFLHGFSYADTDTFFNEKED